VVFHELREFLQPNRSSNVMSHFLWGLKQRNEPTDMQILKPLRLFIFPYTHIRYSDHGELKILRTCTHFEKMGIACLQLSCEDEAVYACGKRMNVDLRKRSG